MIDRTIDLDDVQPGVLDITTPPDAVVAGRELFGRLRGTTDSERRTSLRALLSASQKLTPVGVETTIGITATGMARLGVARSLIAVLSAPFVLGAPARAGLLGDPDPSTWKHGLGLSAEGAHDLVVMAARYDGTAPDISSLVALLNTTEVVVTFLTSDRRERFGFVDGISNPVLAGSGMEVRAGAGVRMPGGWRALAAGEIICGYPDETGNRAGPVAAHELTRNGSYLVWRKMAQQVPAFKALVDSVHCSEHRDVGDPDGGDPTAPGHDWCLSCAARIIGRHQNGDALSPAAIGKNGFDFQEPTTCGTKPDPNSHIYRGNPRRGDGFEQSAVDRHRMLRRGIRWKEGDQEGLVFRCYQADLERSFEFVQRTWMNSGDAFAQGRCRDAIVGQPRADNKDPLDVERTLLWLDEKHVISQPVTTVLGTLYAFVPGYRVLQSLAATTNRWAEPELP